jgi:hypothetical protein
VFIGRSGGGLKRRRQRQKFKLLGLKCLKFLFLVLKHFENLRQEQGRIEEEKAEAENRRFTTDTVPNLLLPYMWLSGRSRGG